MEDRGWLGGAHGQYRGIYNQIYNVQKYIVTVIIQVGSNRVVVHGMQWAAMVVQKKKEKKGGGGGGGPPFSFSTTNANSSAEECYNEYNQQQ